MGSQRVGHNWVTEQQQMFPYYIFHCNWHPYTYYLYICCNFLVIESSELELLCQRVLINLRLLINNAKIISKIVIFIILQSAINKSADFFMFPLISRIIFKKQYKIGGYFKMTLFSSVISVGPQFWKFQRPKGFRTFFCSPMQMCIMHEYFRRAGNAKAMLSIGCLYILFI